jgi:hypothetical protein
MWLVFHRKRGKFKPENALDEPYQSPMDRLIPAKST